MHSLVSVNYAIVTQFDFCLRNTLWTKLKENEDIKCFKDWSYAQVFMCEYGKFLSLYKHNERVYLCGIGG